MLRRAVLQYTQVPRILNPLVLVLGEVRPWGGGSGLGPAEGGEVGPHAERGWGA